MKYPDDFINKVIQGDCFEVMKHLPDKCVELTVTSPPYDNLRDYTGYCFDFENIVKQLFRITKEGCVVVWVVSDATIEGSETCTSFKQALYFKKIGFNLHDTMIYQKISPYPANTRYQQDFEYMFVFSVGKVKTFNPIKTKKTTSHLRKVGNTFRQKDGSLQKPDANAIRRMVRAREFNDKNESNIWHLQAGYMKGTRDKIAFEHPASYPDELVQRHIVSWSNENDVVLDPFLGSGTTAKMAKLLKRNFIGIEISKKYCEIAESRLKQEMLF